MFNIFKVIFSLTVILVSTKYAKLTIETIDLLTSSIHLSRTVQSSRLRKIGLSGIRDGANRPRLIQITKKLPEFQHKTDLLTGKIPRNAQLPTSGFLSTLFVSQRMVWSILQSCIQISNYNILLLY